jgi:hypothetical protein
VVAVVAAVVGGCALAAAVSFTRAFTLPADVVTAVPLAAMLVAQVVFAVRARHRRRGSGTASAQPVAATVVRLRFRRFIPWLVVTIAVVSFELIVLFHLPRQAHPTLSSLSDELSQWRIGKAALFIAWLSLGWLFLRRRPVAVRGSTEP